MTPEEHLAEAVAVRDTALYRIRRAFHEKWSTYRKCGVCGGQIRLNNVLDMFRVGDRKCPHGEHDVVITKGAYSWIRTPHGHCEAGAGGCEACDEDARTHWTALT